MSEAAAEAARDQHSYRRILVSTSLIGGATLLVIIVGIVRTKILALLAKPEGIGLLGVLTNVSSIVTTIAGFGLATSAVRDLAAAGQPAAEGRNPPCEQVGLLQAVLAITTMNITLVLVAMSADYFPRLSAAAGQQDQANAIVNNQLHVALLLGAPLILAMIAGAPLVLSLLLQQRLWRSGNHASLAAHRRSLQDSGWAFGFVILARGNRGAYVLVELLFALVSLRLSAQR